MSQKLQILMYHRVFARRDALLPDVPDQSHFDAQMRTLARYFNVLGLSEAVSLLREGALPRRAVAISFDDGYRDNAEVAAPILRKYNLPATLFVASDYLDGGCMWNDRLIESVRNTKFNDVVLEVAGIGRLSFESDMHRRSAISKLIATCKYLPIDQRNRVTAQIVRSLDADVPDDLMLSSDQLRDIARDVFEIGGHTSSHPILAECEDGVARTEIEENKKRLEDLTQQAIVGFAYPNGTPGRDYSLEHRKMVESVGFEYAVSTDWGSAVRADDVFQLPRVGFFEKSQMKFAAKMLKARLDRAQNLLT